MLNIILGGSPGSGKGTISEIVCDKYGLQHLSTGDVLRNEIKSGSQLGKEIEAIISQGNLVPDEKMIDLIGNFLNSLGEDCNGVVFDGFPRTVDQARALTTLLEEHKMDIVMLDLYAEEETVISRLLHRGETSGRADDNLETIKKRLEVYKTQTRPISEYYMNRKEYFQINSNVNPVCTFGQIERIINWIKE